MNKFKHKYKVGDKVFIHQIEDEDSYLYKTGKIINLIVDNEHGFEYEVKFHTKWKLPLKEDYFEEKELLVYKNLKTIKVLYGI